MDPSLNEDQLEKPYLRENLLLHLFEHYLQLLKLNGSYQEKNNIAQLIFLLLDCSQKFMIVLIKAAGFNHFDVLFLDIHYLILMKLRNRKYYYKVIAIESTI